MTKIDKNLLFLYSENAREKIADMASLLKKSPQRLKYSVRMLEKDSIVHNPHCIFDYSYLGQILFRVYFRGGYIGEKDKSAILKKLAENPYVVSIYELSGEFDLALELESPNPSRFNKELKKIAYLVPTLNNYEMVLNVVSYVYPRAYLVKNIPVTQPEIIIGGDRDVKNLDENELKILKNLLEEPQIRYSRLARKSGMNVKTAVKILNDLKANDIIRGFKFTVSAENIGIVRTRLFLNLHNLSNERENELMGFLGRTKEIVGMNKTVGHWDMEIDIESMEKSKSRQLIVLLREEFKDIIQTFNSIEFYQYYKRSYLPKYLFE